MDLMRLLLFVMLLLPGISNTQDAWTLEKCVVHAIQANISAAQADLAVDRAKINLSQARQTRMPNLSGNSNLNWNFGRTVDPTTNEFITETFFSNGFSLSTGMSIYNGKQISNSIRQSAVDLEAARNDALQTRQTIALQVASNFLNVLFAKENISISERQLELNRQQLDQTQSLIDAGARAASEILNLEAQVATSEQALIVSMNNFDIAMLQLKQILRLDPGYPLSIVAPENVNFSTDPELVAFEEAFAQAIQNRPDLKSSSLQVQSAELGIQIAKGALAPNISIGGNLRTNYSNQGFELDFIETTETLNFLVSSTDPRFPIENLPLTFTSESVSPIRRDLEYFDQFDNNLSYGFGANISIPIYNRGASRADIQRAKINASNARLNYDQVFENLKITVQQSLADARAAKKKLEASEKTLEAQKLAFQNTTKRLELGAANTFEWQQQRTQAENAELQRLIDKYDYLFKIKILEFYLGKPLKL